MGLGSESCRGLFLWMSPERKMRRSIAVALSAFLVVSAYAAGQLPQRKTTQTKEYLIEYSGGDEAYVAALESHLPLRLTTEAPPATVPFSVADLGARRAQVLEAIATRLALTGPPPKMSETFDAFVAGFTALQSLKPLEAARRFALWRKAELEARLGAGQQVAG